MTPLELISHLVQHASSVWRSSRDGSAATGPVHLHRRLLAAPGKSSERNGRRLSKENWSAGGGAGRARALTSRNCQWAALPRQSHDPARRATRVQRARQTLWDVGCHRLGLAKISTLYLVLCHHLPELALVRYCNSRACGFINSLAVVRLLRASVYVNKHWPHRVRDVSSARNTLNLKHRFS